MLQSPSPSLGRNRPPPAAVVSRASVIIQLGIEMLEAGRHLAGRNRGDVVVGQIEGADGPTIEVGRLALPGRTGAASTAGGGISCFG